MENRTVVIRGGRVSLGWFLADDFAAVHAFASDPRVCEFMTWGPNSPAETHRFLTARLMPTADNYQLAAIAEGVVIGSAAVWVTDEQHLSGEIGYSLAADSWGKGYGTEVASLLIEIGRERLGLVRIAATCDVDNHASAAVLEKAGMSREGTHRAFRIVRGQRRDHHVYAVVTDPD